MKHLCSYTLLFRISAKDNNDSLRSEETTTTSTSADIVQLHTIIHFIIEILVQIHPKVGLGPRSMST